MLVEAGDEELQDLVEGDGVPRAVRGDVDDLQLDRVDEEEGLRAERGAGAVLQPVGGIVAGFMNCHGGQKNLRFQKKSSLMISKSSKKSSQESSTFCDQVKTQLET